MKYAFHHCVSTAIRATLNEYEWFIQQFLHQQKVIMVTPPKLPTKSRRQAAQSESNQTQWVYRFDETDKVQEMLGGSWDKVRALLGGKGAGLADMTRTKLPVFRHY
jgi:acyl carrier protein phosphodiesterase